MGWCEHTKDGVKCGQSCDGEPYVLLVDGAPAMSRTYCSLHAPKLYEKKQIVLGQSFGMIDDVVVESEWVRARDLLPEEDADDEPDPDAVRERFLEDELHGQMERDIFGDDQ
jgi:hypothetical protein